MISEREARQLIVWQGDFAFVCKRVSHYRNAIITSIFPAGVALLARAVHCAAEPELTLQWRPVE